MRRQSGFWCMCIGVAMGMSGELFVRIPSLGFMAMYDVVAYAVAVPILFKNWTRMGRHMRRSLKWAFAWTFAAMLSNLFHFTDARYWLKCVALASSSWALMAAAYWLLKDKPLTYMWYLVGSGIGGWIGIYYFRNGSLEGFASGAGDFGSVGSSTENLIEKQIFPYIARGIFLGCTLPFFIWWKKLPVFGIFVGAIFAGFYLLLHGGSRSSFGMFCASAAFGFCVAYGGRALRRMAKNPFLMLLVASVGVAILFAGYKYMAKSGKMGESEKDKLESEFGEHGTGVVSGRAGFHYAIKDAVRTWGIGIGTHLRCHSVMANSLACEGFIGFFFWVFFYVQVLWFVCHRLVYSGRNSTFILLMILTACWDVFGSPFGGRHKFFVLMTLMALCRDRPQYGVGTLFDEKLLGRQGMRNRIGWGAWR